MSVNGSIDTIYELLIYSVAVLIIFLMMFRFRGWFEALKPKEKKNVNKKEVIKETIKEVKEVEIKDAVKVCNEADVDNLSIESSTNTRQSKTSCVYDNYLYDRFVVSPSEVDSNITQNVFDGFISDNELHNIRDKKVNIHVNDVEQSVGYKDTLYNRISQMANENTERKEKLLNDFDKLPREIKLILIENIMQKM